MAHELYECLPGAVAEKDLSTKQYYIVEISGDGPQVDVCDGAGDLPIGVLQNKPNAAGKAAEVAVSGICKVISDGTAAIATGETVGTNATGMAIKKSTDADFVLGTALSPSAASGTIITVLLTPGAQRAS